MRDTQGCVTVDLSTCKFMRLAWLGHSPAGPTTQSGVLRKFYSNPQKKAELPRLSARAFRAETLCLRQYGLIFKEVSVGPLRGQQHHASDADWM